MIFLFFFFNDTATTEIYTLSLHDALPISPAGLLHGVLQARDGRDETDRDDRGVNPHRDRLDRKSTRLNSSHQIISYAVFCLKKKKKNKTCSAKHRARLMRYHDAARQRQHL